MTVSPYTRPLAPASVTSALGALRAGGLRISAARRLVLEALFAADGPVSADRLAGGLGGRLPGSDLAPLYRNLETLPRPGSWSTSTSPRPGPYVVTGRADGGAGCEACGRSTGSSATRPRACARRSAARPASRPASPFPARRRLPGVRGGTVMSAVRRAFAPAEWRQLGRLGLAIAGAARRRSGDAARDRGRQRPARSRSASGLTAYTLGMRHAFDADHIAAIDNTTRKLTTAGQPAAQRRVLVLARPLQRRLRPVPPACPGGSFTGRPGRRTTPPRCSRLWVWSARSCPARSSYAIGLVNSVVLARHRQRSPLGCGGELDLDELEAQLDARGRSSDLLHPLTGRCASRATCIRSGLLFGLGFDTATEVSLLVLAGGAAAFAAAGLRGPRACRSCSQPA